MSYPWEATVIENSTAPYPDGWTPHFIASLAISLVIMVVLAIAVAFVSLKIHQERRGDIESGYPPRSEGGGSGGGGGEVCRGRHYERRRNAHVRGYCPGPDPAVLRTRGGALHGLQPKGATSTHRRKPGRGSRDPGHQRQWRKLEARRKKQERRERRERRRKKRREKREKRKERNERIEDWIREVPHQRYSMMGRHCASCWSGQ